MEKTINIVDAMCGMGKTSAAINYINASPDDKHFLYITPYLDEVNRIINSCPSKHFAQPKDYGSKLKDIKRLFNEKKNIVSTHALFSMFDDETIDIVKTYGYTLIMDEVADVVQPLDISKDDLKTILDNYTQLTENHMLKWVMQEYKGEFEKYKNLCNLDAVYYYAGTALLWMFPVKTFVAFDDVYILTYMFDAQVQRYYYDFYDLEYKYLYIKGNSLDTYEFTEEKIQYTYSNLSSLITIINNDKMDRIGSMDTSLSKAWYMRNQENGCIKELKNCLINFFRRIVNTPSNQNMWTTFKKFQPVLSSGGYSKGFIPCNARATNEYRRCVSLAYPVNRYLNTVVKNFFINREVRVEEDGYATSELVQWIFRSAIRDGKPITLYIPSRRMRQLLINWINNLCGSEITDDSKIEIRKREGVLNENSNN